MKKTLTRTPASDIEREISKRLSFVTCLPGTFDKRFCRDIKHVCHSPEGITENQRDILYKLLKKYRRQIANYKEICIWISQEIKSNQFKPQNLSDIV